MDNLDNSKSRVEEKKHFQELSAVFTIPPSSYGRPQQHNVKKMVQVGILYLNVYSQMRVRLEQQIFAIEYQD